MPDNNLSGDIKVKKNGWQVTVPIGVLLIIVGVFLGNRVIPASATIGDTAKTPQELVDIRRELVEHAERILTLEKTAFQNKTLIEGLKTDFDKVDKRNIEAHDRIETKLDTLMRLIPKGI